MTLTDARGVEIAPGDIVIYGFAVGRSVAMAEGVVLGEEHADSGKASPYGGTLCTCKDELHPHLNPSLSVSLTPSGCAGAPYRCRRSALSSSLTVS